MKSITERDIKFLLKEPKSTQPTLISMVLRFHNQRLVYSTGKSILPADWNAAEGRARIAKKTRYDNQPFEAINKELSRYASALQTVYTRLLVAEEEITVLALKKLLDKELGRDIERERAQAKPSEKRLLVFWKQFIEDCKQGDQLTVNEDRYADATIKNFNRSLNQLTRFEKSLGKPIEFEQVDMVFYNKMVRFFTNEGKARNSIGSAIKDLKVILKLTYQKHHNNRIFENPKFKKLREDVDAIYLKTEELQRLYDLDLSNNKRLESVRDMFLIGAYTGMRFSDFTRLKPEHITNGGTTIAIEMQKVKGTPVIPLNPNARAILHKYDCNLPRAISNQKFNAYLKELAQLVELTDKVETTRTQGGKRTTTTTEKWQLVRSHTARRSFATNAVLGGVETHKIMKITGHKTEMAFLRYVKISTEENALDLRSHPHFSGVDTERKSVFKIVA